MAKKIQEEQRNQATVLIQKKVEIQTWSECSKKLRKSSSTTLPQT